MFRATDRSSLGAKNCICSLWFICPHGHRPRLSGHSVPTQPWQRPVTIRAYKPETANIVWSSWCWAVCRSRHVDPLKIFGIINSISKLHLVGISTEYFNGSNVFLTLDFLSGVPWWYRQTVRQQTVCEGNSVFMTLERHIILFTLTDHHTNIATDHISKTMVIFATWRRVA
jgi:hypothetical protein